MPKEYTVQAPDGREITFEWGGDQDPTDAEMEEIFASAGGPSEDFSGVNSGATTSQPTAMQNLASQVQDIWAKPGESINRGMYQMFPKDRAPNLMAGPLNIASGAAQTAMAPLGTLSAMVDAIPDELANTNPLVGGVKMANRAATSALGPIGEFAQRHFTEGIKPILGAVVPFMGQGGIEEIAQPFGELGSMGVQAAAGNAVVKTPANVRAVGRGVRGAADRVMGSALQTGENLSRAKELARFANENQLTLNEAGKTRAQNIVQSLQYDINEGIINPLTANGNFVKRTPVLDGLKKIRQAMSEEVIPDNAAIKRVEKKITALEEEIASKGEYMTPGKAQSIKTELNSELAEYYKKRQKVGGLSKKETTNVRTLAEANDSIRSQLESMHPELKGLNWEQGRGLEVRRAIDEYLTKKFKGELKVGGPGWTAAAGGSPMAMASLSAYDLLGTRSFRSKLANLLDKVGRGLSGESKRPITRLKNPVKPNPPAKGLLPPWGGSPIPEVGYRSPLVPIPMGGPTGSQMNVTTGPPFPVPGEYIDVFGVKRKH